MNRYKTPLRYPGGKQRLAPFVREILEENELLGGDYVEPYAGGAGVAIELLIADDVARVHLNDASVPLQAFWTSILEETEAFCRLVAGASLTVEEWQRQKAILADPNAGRLDLGFSFFFLNRCNRSGITTGGVIGGLAQAGEWKIDARFNRRALIARIEAIAYRKERILVTNLDAEDFIKSNLKGLPKRSLVYLDPPYFRKAERLYRNFYAPEDHARIARVIQRTIWTPWIVSYDGADEILDHYAARQFFQYDLQYNAARAYKGREVFFFSDRLRIPGRSSIQAIDLVLQEMGA